MTTTVEGLINSFGQVLAAPDLAPEGKISSTEEHDFDIPSAANVFKDMFGMHCPTSLQLGLIIPNNISVRWQYSREVSGEVQLSELIRSMYRELDPSLNDAVIDQHLLRNMRVVDAVTVKAGPFYTLFEIEGDRILDQLFLYDLRDLQKLELSYDSYIDFASITRGIVYWQLLFCPRRVTPDEAKVLAAELAFLESRFPAPELDALQTRLHERYR